MQINDTFETLPESYLFSTVGRKLREYPVSYTHLTLPTT